VTTIEITDRDDQGGLRPGLREILSIIRDEGEVMYWRIAALEAAGDLSSWGTTMLDFEAKISGYPQGMPITWGELWNFSELIEQALEISLAASHIPGFDSDVQSVDLSPPAVAINLIDGSVWQVISSSDTFIQRYITAFHAVCIVDP
jgi:hypothetical protein